MPDRKQHNVESQRRFRAKHRRIDYSPKPEIWTAIEQHLFGDLGKSITGVIDKLILAGHDAITGNLDAGELVSPPGAEHEGEIRHRQLTPLQEKFACAVATGNQSLTASYREFYNPQNAKPKTVNKMAAELAALPHVAARIRSIREGVTAAVIKQTAYSRADALEEAGEVMRDALARRQMGAAVAAVALRARLAGLLVRNKSSRSGWQSHGSDLQEGDAEALTKMLEDIKRKRNALLATESDSLTCEGTVPAPEVVE